MSRPAINQKERCFRPPISLFPFSFPFSFAFAFAITEKSLEWRAFGDITQTSTDGNF